MKIPFTGEKSLIVGHRVWYDYDLNRGSQAAIRLGFILGLMGGILRGEYWRSGLFADANYQLVGLAVVWALFPGAYSWGRGNLVKHEEGPAIQGIDLEI